MKKITGGAKSTSRIYRDEFADSLKATLIFFVVYGHILEFNIPDESINCTIRNFIYLFHMPLFIFLSGMFAHIKDRRKYMKSIIMLIETYLIFHLLHYLVPLPYYRPLTLLNYIIYPTWTMWYLLSLASWRLIVYAIGETTMRKKKVLFITFSIIISILGGFVPVGPHLSLQRTMCFLPFFVCGFYCNMSDMRYAISRIPIVLAMTICVCATVGLYFFVKINLGYIVLGSSNYYVNDNPIISLILRLLFFVCTIILSVSVARLVPTNKYLADIGRHTLFIYIVHSFVAVVILLIMRSYPFMGSTLSILLLSTITTIGLYILAKTKINLILNPISNLYSFIKKQ